MATNFDVVVPQEEVEQFLETWINELHGKDIYVSEGGAYFPKWPSQSNGLLDKESNESNEDLNLANMEKKMILAAMKKTNNNQTEAATLLGIGRSALRHRLKKIGYKK